MSVVRTPVTKSKDYQRLQGCITLGVSNMHVFILRNNLPIPDILQEMDSIHTEFHTRIHHLELVYRIVKAMARDTHQVPLQLLDSVDQVSCIFNFILTRQGSIMKSVLEDFLLSSKNPKPPYTQWKPPSQTTETTTSE